MQQATTTLQRYFAGVAEYVFQTHLGLADVSLVDYLSDMLIRFVRIDAVHRVRNLSGRPMTEVAEMLAEARQFPDIYYAGYTQDAMKELAEAYLTRALILSEAPPTPAELDVENAAYVNGLAEAVGELRRYALDALRRGDVKESERMLDLMDEIYTGLITVDFPSAITSGLRRSTDVARSIIERTQGDVTTAVRQEAMKQALTNFEQRVQKLSNS